MKLKRTLYDTGLPFLKPLDENLNSLKNRIKLNKASLVIIDGGVGEGKTTLAVHCADYFNGDYIQFEKQLAMGGEEFQEKLQICFDSKLPVIIYDEAGDFNSRGALTKFNQQLNRVFETYRTFHIMVILTLPNSGVLDSSIVDKQIPRLLLNCHSRTKNQGRYRAYSLYRLYYLRNKLKKYIVSPHAYNSTTPNFHGCFLDLTPERSKELNKYTTKGKQKVLNKNILNNRGLVSYKDIAKSISRSDIWVRQKISELKIKSVNKYKQRLYFDKSVIELLKTKLGY